jgi:hypothetical protein
MRNNYLISCLIFLLCMTANASEPEINTLKNSFFGGRTEFAINGYDTVAYFTQNKPVKGDDKFVFEWKNAKWKFSTQANVDLFKANPEKYAPQYGGYCAYGVAQGALVSVEPEQFAILENKLYLNYSADIQRKWLKDPQGFNRVADVQFEKLLTQ